MSKIASKSRNISTIAKKLDTLLAKEIEYVPYKKDNTVYIKNYRIVKKDKHVYLVYRDSVLIANLFYKKSAFAVVNNLVHRKNIEAVIDHDKQLEKNYNDSLFYLNTISLTKSETKFEVAQHRLDISKAKIEQHLNVIGDLAKWH